MITLSFWKYSPFSGFIISQCSGFSSTSLVVGSSSSVGPVVIEAAHVSGWGSQLCFPSLFS
jgi:hypothetical protein